MRTLILLLSLFCCACKAGTLTNNFSCPIQFETADAMSRWAYSTPGGTNEKLLRYKQHDLMVYFRTYGSGSPYIEPVVFVKYKDRWRRVLCGPICRFELRVTIENNMLMLWRFKDKGEKSEFLRFNLDNLDEVF